MVQIKIELSLDEVEELVSEFDKLRLIDKYESALDYMSSPIGRLIQKLGKPFRKALGFKFKEDR